MRFSDIIGHQDVKQRLIQSVVEQRVPHAQLFCGHEGIGKLRLAVAYAQYMACPNRSESDSCGVCPSCVKYSKLVHPDLHFVFPITKSSDKDVCDTYVGLFREMILTNDYFGLEDWMAFAFEDSKKQAYIFANESSEIIEKLSIKSYEAEYKIMIIWLPERMYKDNAFGNKILKILEEPPQDTVFLLVSNQPNELLPTILSRTQLINISPVNVNEIAERLLSENQFDISEEDALRIARIANGSVLEAIRIVTDDEENRVNFERFTQLFREAWRLGAGQIPADKKLAALKTLRTWADDLAAVRVGREKQKKFLIYAQRMLRENFILNLQQPSLNYLTITEENFSERFAQFITERNIEPMVSEFALAERQIGQNSNAKIVFFDLALKMIMLLKK
ncbi:MAG: DNA polymerase III subunit delta [Prevotellaceae bacterium]|jgi:DNA polymerase-3 subunit delta'|nr:DNA polymerase III subunit delta [Prevotellaceae bacterium]